MNRFLIPALLTLAPFAGLRADENFIMQEVVVNGQTIQYKIPVANAEGEVVSQPIDSDSAIFRLYTIYTDSASKLQTLLLDTKSIGTYMPSSKVTISSQDPYVPARTRADQPYGVSVNVSGLSSDAAAPAAGKSVRVVRSYKIYSPTTMAATAGDKGTDYTNPFTLDKNTTYSLSDGNAAGGFLPRLDMLENPKSALMGEESYTVYTGGSTTTATVLASGSIRVWPIADALFTGIEKAKIYQTIPVGAAIQCNNLYPGCLVYAQIYRGVPGAPLNAAQKIPSAVLQYSAETREPQTQRFPLNDLATFINEDGDYTIEIMTVTPFNAKKPELISGGTVSFGIKRTIRVNAGINTIATE